MFIWDFVLGTVMDQIIEWLYGQVVGFLADFFLHRWETWAWELFEMNWVKSIALFFSYLAWALWGPALWSRYFETGIEYQHGRGSVKGCRLKCPQRLWRRCPFTILPVELFKLPVNLQSSITAGITGHGSSFGDLAGNIIAELGSSRMSVAPWLRCL